MLPVDETPQLADYGLAQALPESGYATGVNKTETSLAYSILYRGSKGAARNLEQRLKLFPTPAKKRQYLEPKLTAYGLTPLIICAVVEDVSTAGRLFETGVDPLAADCRGWTAYHHAAVRLDRTMMDLFEERCPKIVSAKTGSGHVAEQLMKLVYVDKSAPEPCFWYQRPDGAIVQGDGALFRELTGAKLINRTRMAAKELICAWREDKLVDGVASREPFVSLHKGLLKAAEHPIYLFTHEAPEAGYGVKIRERAIQAGQLICDYEGMIRTQPDGMSRYRIDTEQLSLDGRYERGMGAMINHSFPNAQFLPYVGDGLRSTRVVSCDRIEAGEEVLVNYGPTYGDGTEGVLSELNWTGIGRFLESGALEKHIDRLGTLFLLSQAIGGSENFLAMTGLGARLTYLQSHVGVLWQLLMEKRVTIESVRALMIGEKARDCVFGGLTTEAADAKFFVMKNMHGFLQLLGREADQARQALEQELLTIARTVGVGAMLVSMSIYLNKALLKPAAQSWGEWNAYWAEPIRAAVKREERARMVMTHFLNGNPDYGVPELEQALIEALRPDEHRLAIDFNATSLLGLISTQERHREVFVAAIATALERWQIPMSDLKRGQPPMWEC